MGDEAKANACELLRQRMLERGWRHADNPGELTSPDDTLRAVTYFAGGTYWIEVLAVVNPTRIEITPDMRIEDIL